MKRQREGAPHGGLALHHRQTFDRDTDRVVCWTELIVGTAAVISRVLLWHVHNTERLLVVQEGCALGWENAALFGPGDFRGGPEFKQEKTEMTALEQMVTWGFHVSSNGELFHLQSIGNTLHLQHLSSQHHLGAGRARWDEEGWLPLIHWVSYSFTHRFTKSTIIISSSSVRKQAESRPFTLTHLLLLYSVV